ncbi:MAG: DUF2147 domain-containing protein [Rhabdochlamydiaceae bacterium]
MKTQIFVFIFYLNSILANASIEGLWIIPGKKGKTDAVVKLYGHENKYYGRIVAIYDHKGAIDETIKNPKTRAFQLKNKPYYTEFDFIWDLKKQKQKYIGKIINPENGKIYKAKLWVEGESLFVRGELFLFGQTQKWEKAKQSIFEEFNQLEPLSPHILIASR